MALKLIQGKQINVNLTGSFTGSFSGSFEGTGSYAINALTASYLEGYISPFPFTGSAQITGSLEVTGSLNVSEGITGSLFGTASYAENFNETDPIFVAKSGSLATTGSNLFTDNQTIDAGSTDGFGSGIKFTNQGAAHYTAGISGSTFVIADTSANYYSPWAGADIKLQVGATGSIFNTNVRVTGSNGYILLTPTIGSPNLAIQEIHSNDDAPWAARFFNDTFSTTNSVMSYFGWNDGRFVFHNDSTQSIGLQVNGYSAENGLLVYQDKVAFINNVEVTGSINAPSITGSLFGTSSWAENSTTSSNALTASYLNTLNQDLTFNGNLTLNGTASISFLNVTYESASIIYSSGSNQLGDATNDIQTLIGTVIVSGSQQITGSLDVTQGITGSLFGTSSWAQNSISSSRAISAATASYSTTLGAGLGQYYGTNTVNLTNSSGSVLSYVTINNVANAAYANNAAYATSAGTATAIGTYQAASTDQINQGTEGNDDYQYVVRAKQLEESKHTTINIYNNLNFI